MASCAVDVEDSNRMGVIVRKRKSGSIRYGSGEILPRIRSG